MCRGHLDVDNNDVGFGTANLSQKPLGVVCLGDDVDAGVSEEMGDSFSRQHRIVSDYHPHGITADTHDPVMSQCPPIAPTRSADVVQVVDGAHCAVVDEFYPKLVGIVGERRDETCRRPFHGVPNR